MLLLDLHSLLEDLLELHLHLLWELALVLAIILRSFGVVLSLCGVLQELYDLLSGQVVRDVVSLAGTLDRHDIALDSLVLLHLNHHLLFLLERSLELVLALPVLLLWRSLINDGLLDVFPFLTIFLEFLILILLHSFVHFLLVLALLLLYIPEALVLIQGHKDLLTIWSNLDLVGSLLWPNEGVLHAVVALDDIGLVPVQHAVLSLLGLELGLEVVGRILGHLVLQVLLGEALVGLGSLLATLLLRRQRLLSLRYEAAEHVIPGVPVDLGGQLLALGDGVGKVLLEGSSEPDGRERLGARVKGDRPYIKRAPCLVGGAPFLASMPGPGAGSSNSLVAPRLFRRNSGRGRGLSLRRLRGPASAPQVGALRQVLKLLLLLLDERLLVLHLLLLYG